MSRLEGLKEKVLSLLKAEGVDISDNDAVADCLSECVGPKLCQVAFDEMVDNAPFARISRTPSEKGYHYGLLKEDRPLMPECQLSAVSTYLDIGWSWWDETDGGVIGLNHVFSDGIQHKDFHPDGSITTK